MVYLGLRTGCFFGYGRQDTVITGSLECETGSKTAINGCDSRFPYYPKDFIVYSFFLILKGLY